MGTQYAVFVAVIYLFVFLFGVCIGSFLNVCIYRLPTGESLTKKNSHCMTCGEPIKRRDLIPIISWCFLRGKCRHCKAKISPRYTIVEALNGILFLLVAHRFDVIVHPLYVTLVCLLFSALVVVFFMDWDTQLINTWVVVFIGLMGVLSTIFCTQYTQISLKSHIIGFFVVSVPLLIIVLASHEKAMGWGDVYLMAGAGIFLGIQGSIVALLIALISGSVGGLIQKHFSGNSVFAFGPYLSLGIAVSVFYSEALGNWYMNFTGLNETLEAALRVI